MQKFNYKIQDPVGMHARPASKLVQELTQFTSSVTISVNDKTVNAKSIINLMSLGMKKDSEVVFTIEGDDETLLLEKLPEILSKHKI